LYSRPRYCPCSCDTTAAPWWPPRPHQLNCPTNQPTNRATILPHALSTGPTAELGWAAVWLRGFLLYSLRPVNYPPTRCHGHRPSSEEEGMRKSSSPPPGPLLRRRRTPLRCVGRQIPINYHSGFMVRCQSTCLRSNPTEIGAAAILQRMSVHSRTSRVQY